MNFTTSFVIIIMLTGPAFPQVRAFFGEGNGPIHLKNVQCSSSNNRLADCQSSFNTQDCGHYQDAGVTCSGNLVAISYSPS